MLMGVFERRADLLGDFYHGRKVGRWSVVQTGAVDHLHHDERCVAGLASIEDRDDVGVAELGNRLGFVE